MAGVMSDSPQNDTAGILQKIVLTGRNLNKNLKYFNPLVSGPGRFEIGSGKVTWLPAVS